MDDLLAARVAAQLGAFSHVDAYDCGYTTKTLHRLVASGRARRVGPRAYVDGAAFDAGTPEQRHAMTTRAMVRSSAGRLAASHHSSLSLLALPLFGVPMDVVHLVSTSSPRCRRSPVWQIHRGFGEGSLCRVDGVLSVARHWRSSAPQAWAASRLVSSLPTRLLQRAVRPTPSCGAGSSG